MQQLIFGRTNQVSFQNETEFYQALGFLSKSNGSTSLVWEENERSGAWGSEGRIECFIPQNQFPPCFSNCSFTAGNGGRILHRINCNEFMQHIRNDFGFIMGRSQPVQIIRGNVPTNYLAAFDYGYNY
jgi:hypothetical protein